MLATEAHPLTSADVETDRVRTDDLLAVPFVVCPVLSYDLPFAMIVVGNLQKRWVGVRFQFVDWSLEEYRVLLVGSRSSVFYESIVNALLLGVFAASLALVLAVVISFLGIETDWAGGTSLNYLF